MPPAGSRGGDRQEHRAQPGGRRPGATAATSDGSDRHPRPSDANPYEDLCSSCQERDECDRPRPEGGVWRCADYRQGEP